MSRALVDYDERLEKPEEIAPAIKRARRATEEGTAALLEFITGEEIAYSHQRALLGLKPNVISSHFCSGVG